MIRAKRKQLSTKFENQVTERDRVVIENTRIGVKIKSKFTNFKINSRNEGYNGKSSSNPQ